MTDDVHLHLIAIVESLRLVITRKAGPSTRGNISGDRGISVVVPFLRCLLKIVERSGDDPAAIEVLAAIEELLNHDECPSVEVLLPQIDLAANQFERRDIAESLDELWNSLNSDAEYE
jgi:hypothetical protein